MRINENEGPKGKKRKLSQIWIRPNMALGKSHFFGFVKARALRRKKRIREEEERKEEEKEKKSKV